MSLPCLSLNLRLVKEETQSEAPASVEAEAAAQTANPKQTAHNANEPTVATTSGLEAEKKADNVPAKFSSPEETSMVPQPKELVVKAPIDISGASEVVPAKTAMNSFVVKAPVIKSTEEPMTSGEVKDTTAEDEPHNPVVEEEMLPEPETSSELETVPTIEPMPKEKGSQEQHAAQALAALGEVDVVEEPIVAVKEPVEAVPAAVVANTEPGPVETPEEQAAADVPCKLEAVKEEAAVKFAESGTPVVDEPSQDKLIILSTSSKTCLAEPEAVLEAETHVPAMAKEETGSSTVVEDDSMAKPASEENKATDKVDTEARAEKADVVAPASETSAVNATRKESKVETDKEPICATTEPVSESTAPEGEESAPEVATPLESAPPVKAEAGKETEILQATPEDLQPIILSDKQAATTPGEVEEPTVLGAGLLLDAAEATAVPNVVSKNVKPMDKICAEKAPVPDAGAINKPTLYVTSELDQVQTKQLQVSYTERPECHMSLWMPSYTVSTQGQNLAAEEQAEEPQANTSTEEPAIVLTEAKVNAAGHPAESAVPIETTNSWPVLYTASSQATVALPTENYMSHKLEESKANSEPEAGTQPVVKNDTSEELPPPQIVATDEESQLVSPVVIADHEDNIPAQKASQRLSLKHKNVPLQEDCETRSVSSLKEPEIAQVETPEQVEAASSQPTVKIVAPFLNNHYCEIH
ncbi:hypothetical protein BC835DRAFT_1525718 [Cytidiella melzeri]|nr:hypothetical protein BC835DRAFT_1525718 [Cytidiella melzeri]